VVRVLYGDGADDDPPHFFRRDPPDRGTVLGPERRRLRRVPPADGRGAAPGPGHLRPPGAGGDGESAPAPLRARGAPVPGVRRSSPSHRERPDHLPAVHRGPHDPARGARAGRLRARGRHGVRIPGGRALGDRETGVHHRDRARARGVRESAFRRARVPQRDRARRRRLPRLEGECSLRRRPGHRRRSRDPAAPGRPARPRGDPGHPRGPGGTTTREVLPVRFVPLVREPR
jgi:hypothetical protein